MKAFLRFKYERHELAGIVEDSVRKMLDDESIELRDDTRISAYCNNVIEECDDRISVLLDPSADYTLASIGRLTKPCVPTIVQGFCNFIQNLLSLNCDRLFFRYSCGIRPSW